MVGDKAVLLQTQGGGEKKKRKYGFKLAMVYYLRRIKGEIWEGNSRGGGTT